MPSAMDVANYFLATLGDSEESDLTNMKLQKLCAYSQGLCLGLLGRPMFKDQIEAWQYGPVIATIYREFKEYGNAPIPHQGLSEKYARVPFADDEKFILELAKSYYGIFSAGELSSRSHRDFPGQFGSRNVIPMESIKHSFERDPLVLKMKRDAKSAPCDPPVSAFVPESEIWNVLDV